MRVLKRPMFKYGGPIKEGVMHGLKDGGMPNNQGLRRAALVGNPVYQTGFDGRTRHAVPILVGAATAARGIGALARGAMRLFGKNKYIVDKSFNPGTAIASPGTGAFTPITRGFVPNKFTQYLMDSPEGKFLISGTGLGRKILTGLSKSPTVVAGTGYGAYKLFSGDDDKDKKTVQVSDKEKLSLLKKSNTRVLTSEEKEAQDAARLNKIYKVLGVDRAQKNAASKALADVSKYIDEGGKETISKKNIGSTISKAIGAFDKRLDKVDELKEAAGLMVAKAQVEDMMNPLDKEYKRAQIEALKKQSNPDINYLIAEFRKLGEPNPVDVAAKNLLGEEYGGKIMTKNAFDKQFKVLSDEGGASSYDIIKGIAKNKLDQSFPNISDGYFTVGDYIIKVEEGDVTEILN
jgi:hypothetical protein